MVFATLESSRVRLCPKWGGERTGRIYRYTDAKLPHLIRCASWSDRSNPLLGGAQQAVYLPQMRDELITKLTAALENVAGLEAVVLGGSRGRGTAGPQSDYDIGLYYWRDDPLDINALESAVKPLVDEPNQHVTQLGEWGQWINGGGWLTIDGVKVDLLYRELDLVHHVVDEAQAGRFTMDYQVGHPHGFCSVILAGEVATCRILHECSGQLSDLKKRTSPYSSNLKQALVARFGWEVGFATDNAKLAAQRGEQNHVAGCAYRALSCLAQVIFALNERYLISEKGALPEAATCPITVTG